MQAHHFIMLGLVLDIIGAFLVSVEAIRMENIRALRDKVFRKVQQYALSPRIVVVDDKGVPVAGSTERVPSDSYPGLFMGLHYVAGLLLILLVNDVLEGLVFELLFKLAVLLLDQPWYVVVPIAIVFLLFGVVAGLWLLGELMHELVSRATRFAIQVLDFVDARTPDGTVGVLGFLFLLAGFGLQIYGTYLGSRSR